VKWINNTKESLKAIKNAATLHLILSGITAASLIVIAVELLFICVNLK
jgi:hypothetical protein